MAYVSVTSSRPVSLSAELDDLADALRLCQGPADLFSLARQAGQIGRKASGTTAGASAFAHALLVLLANRLEGEPVGPKEWENALRLVNMLAMWLEHPTAQCLAGVGRAWQSVMRGNR